MEGYFDEKAVHSIGAWIEGADRLYLQNYEESGDVPDKTLKAVSHEKMEEFRDILSGYIKEVGLRGID